MRRLIRSTKTASRPLRALGAALAAALLVLPAFGADAAEKDKKKANKVIRIEEIKVEGRIQKPQAFYLLQRSNLNFEELDRAESFLPKIVRSVEQEPF